MTTSNGINKPCFHWRDCDCLVHKICDYYYYKKTLETTEIQRRELLNYTKEL